MKILIIASLLILALPSFSLSASHVVRDGCKLGGCGGEICSNPEEGDVVSICRWRASHDCYRISGVCEKQNGGGCGWTQSEELVKCLNSSAKSVPPAPVESIPPKTNQGR